MNEIDKLAWVYINSDKRLLVARSKGKDTYYIPGGKREPGESDHAALMREIEEELAVNLIPTTIQYAGVFKAQAHEKSAGLPVKVTCYFAEFSGEVKASAEIEEVIWVSHAEQHKCSPVTVLIMDWLKSTGMIL